MIESLGGNLERYMSLLSSRQKLVASNLANADTPGYKTLDIDFKREFESVLRGDPSTEEVPGLEAKNDGNNVSVDRESRLLAENALRFSIASNLARNQVQLVREAIQGGKTA